MTKNKIMNVFNFRRQTPITEVIKVAQSKNITVTQARDQYFLTPDLTPGAPLLKRSVHACKQR